MRYVKCEKIDRLSQIKHSHQLYRHRFFCGTMLDIRCVGVGKCQSEDSVVCFGAKPTQRACVRDFPRDRKRTWEGRSQAEERSGENKAVGRTEQELGPVANVRG